MWSIGKVTWRMSSLQINHLINSIFQGHSKNNIDSSPIGNSWATANYTGKTCCRGIFALALLLNLFYLQHKLKLLGSNKLYLFNFLLLSSRHDFPL